jgi:hypothetical protein
MLASRRATATSGPLLALFVLGEAHAWAGGGAATDAYDGIRRGAIVDVHGALDFYLQHDFDRPPSGRVGLRAFDERTDVSSLALARLTLAHRPSPFGFRVDATVGDLANGYLDADPGAAANPGLARGFSYIEQAFASVDIPIGRGLALDVGKFGTPVGYEENEPAANWNDSRSLLFTYGEPTYHTGARLTYAIHARLAFSVFWLNGWNSNFVGNGLRAFAGAASMKPAEAIELVFVYMGGSERAPSNLASSATSFRSEFDAYTIYSLSNDVTLVGTADYGHDAAQGGVDWWGVAGYVRYRVRPWLAVAVRGEHYADPNGFTTATPQRLASAVATVEGRTTVGSVSLRARLEGRRDRSDTPVFDAAPHPRTVQDSITISVGLAF